MKFYSTLLLMVFSLFFLNAQTPKYRVISIPVERNGVQMREPWTGGMDSPQFSECDLNQDGIMDLFVFDRVADRVLTYISNGDGTDTMYTYAPQYEALFPQDLNSWALIRDYNHDGIPDIFTHANTGTRVYKGSFVNGELHFNLVCNLLLYADPPYPGTNIWTTISDIPVITDVNGDGDLDILTYDIVGSQVAYFENQTMEHPGNIHYDIDSFQYQWVSFCWGKFAQNAGNNSIELDARCLSGNASQPQTGNERHSGNSMYNFTDPVYKTIDLLNGNVGFNPLVFLRNCGSDTDAYICEWDSIYPPAGCGFSMAMATYPAAFGINLKDKFDDVLVAPNVYAPTSFSGGNARNVNNVMRYKNTGDTTCWFDYQSDSFLVHHTLDFGTDSKALFYDFNGDGLQDIIVSSYGYFDPATVSQYHSTLAYFQNTGTATSPKFTQITLDYDSMSLYGLLAINPAFGDLDGDGKADMLMGDKNGNIHYFKNTGANGSAFPVMDSLNYFGITIPGGFSAPFIYDVNSDSLNDIVVGRYDGKLSYYWNFGTKTSPKFSRDSVNSHFGYVNVCSYETYEGFSQPFINKDANGKLKLYVGSMQGTIFEYRLDGLDLQRDTFPLIDSNFLGRSVGAFSTISIADLNQDGKMEYIVGNALGGLLMFSDSLWDPSTVLNIREIPSAKNGLRIYPNPAKEYFVCALDNGEFLSPKAEVYNVLGEKMPAGVKTDNGKISISTGQLRSGFYIVKIYDGGAAYTGKILIEQ